MYQDPVFGSRCVLNPGTVAYIMIISVMVGLFIVRDMLSVWTEVRFIGLKVPESDIVPLLGKRKI